jgi:hypothetical protein
MFALVAAAIAAPRAAIAADVKRVPIDKAFRFLAGYLALAPTQRSRFYLAYHAMRDKRPTADAHATIVAPNGVRTAVAFDRLGNVTRLPSLAELNSGATVEIAGAPFQLGIELRCAAAPSTRIDVAQLVASLAQVNEAVVRFAGALSFVIPKLTTAYFPDAAAGRALMGDGRVAPLPVVAVPSVGPIPYIEPGSLVGVRSVVFAKPPSRILLGGAPKKT